MGYFSIWHWLVVIAVALILFGSKKVSSFGTELGLALKNFRDSLNGLDEDSEKKFSKKIEDSLNNLEKTENIEKDKKDDM